jgi:hypothetical protein
MTGGQSNRAKSTGDLVAELLSQERHHGLADPGLVHDQDGAGQRRRA